MRRATRRLTLKDLTLLVGADALAMAGFRHATTEVLPGWLDYGRWPAWIANPNPRAVLYMLSDATAPLIPLASALTGSLLVLRCVPPRPPWKRVWRQPGMAICLAAALAMAWVGVSAAMLWVILGLSPAGREEGILVLQGLLVVHLFPLVGVAVAATGAALLLGSRWSKPADWLDRTGRWLGLLWILIGAAWTLRSYAELF